MHDVSRQNWVIAVQQNIAALHRKTVVVSRQGETMCAEIKATRPNIRDEPIIFILDVNLTGDENEIATLGETDYDPHHYWLIEEVLD